MKREDRGQRTGPASSVKGNAAHPSSNAPCNAPVAQPTSAIEEELRRAIAM
jgi:hypothetical protein